MMADTAITYAGQRTSPTTVTICAYAGVSPALVSAADF